MAFQDVPLPQEIIEWMRARDWGTHHLRWHMERWWYRLSPWERATYTARGWSQAPRQEGDAGNGLEFLAMHRVMLRTLVEAFPQHAQLFAGWSTPPQNPEDPDDTVPGTVGSPARVFPERLRIAVERIEQRPDSFPDDDSFGLYVQTSHDQTAYGAGIHNALHGRWADSTSPIDLGNPLVNMENQRFWRLHGWIDARWTAYRAAMGLSDSDPAYVQALSEARAMMPDGGDLDPDVIVDTHPLAALDDLKATGVTITAAQTSAVGAFLASLRAGGEAPEPQGLSTALLESRVPAPDEPIETVQTIPFSYAEIRPGIVDDTWFLVVSGYKPYANMEIVLQPAEYIRIPEWWRIDVLGVLEGPGLQMVAPFTVAIPLEGARGTDGVRLFGGRRVQTLPVPPADDGPE